MSPQGTIPKVAPPAPKSKTNKGAANVSSLKLSTRTRQQPVPKIVINAVEGWGKTSTVAHAPDVAILEAREERGYENLQDAGLVPEVPCARVEEWPQLIKFLREQVKTTPEYKVLALDALDGFERLCHEWVCDELYNGDWGPQGFGNFGKGYKSSLKEIISMLQLLDQLNEKGITIVFLGHSTIKRQNVPGTEGFDRFICDVNDRTWGVVARWAYAVLFGNYRTVIDKKDGKNIGLGRADRVLYTQRRDIFDAKNQYGMPEQIDVPDDPAKVWETITSYIGG